MDKRKIIMDVDTGSDDAIALIMAMLSPDFDVLGITAVNGNIEVKLTTDNSLRCVELCEKDIPVFKGCEFPMVSTLLPWRKPNIPKREGTRDGQVVVHQDHLPLPAPTTKEQPQSAVVWLIETLLASDGDITLVPVGPLTNIAMAMRADPRIIPKIKEIMIMGGGHDINNTSAASEFNIWVDPESAEIVLQSGVPLITLVPLDATHKAVLTVEDAKRIRSIGTKPAACVADLIEQRTAGYGVNNVDMKEMQGAPIHDALAVCALVHPEVLLDVIECNCHVDISGGFADGETIIDQRERTDKGNQNVRFAKSADKDLFLKWVIEVLEGAK